MSADNGIYILHTKDGWRVEHLQNIENLNWWLIDPNKPEEFEYREAINPSVVYSYFKNAQFFTRQDVALDYACKFSADIGYVEHGICFIERMSDKEFPKQCCEYPEFIVEALDFPYIKYCRKCGAYN